MLKKIMIGGALAVGGYLVYRVVKGNGTDARKVSAATGGLTPEQQQRLNGGWGSTGSSSSSNSNSGGSGGSNTADTIINTLADAIAGMTDAEKQQLNDAYAGRGTTSSDAQRIADALAGLSDAEKEALNDAYIGKGGEGFVFGDEEIAWQNEQIANEQAQS